MLEMYFEKIVQQKTVQSKKKNSPPNIATNKRKSNRELL